MARKRRVGVSLAVPVYLGLSLAGCSGPSDAVVAADFSRLFSGCSLETVEGGTDTYGRWRLKPEEVWIEVWGNCPGGKIWDTLQYQRGGDGKWQLVMRPTKR